MELELYWSVSTTSAELTNTGSVEEVMNAQLNEEAKMVAPDADFADTKTNCGSADVSNAKHEHLLVGSGTQPGQFVDSQRINADKNSVKLPNTLEFFGQDKPAFDPIHFTPHHDQNHYKDLPWEKPPKGGDGGQCGLRGRGVRGDRGRFRGTTSRGCGDRRCLRRYRANRGRFKDILSEARLDFPMSQHQCRDTHQNFTETRKRF